MKPKSESQVPNLTLITPLPAEVTAKAARVVAALIPDDAEAQEVLEMLGLVK